MSRVANSFEFLAPDVDSSYRQLRVKGRRIFARTLYALTVGTEGRMTPEDVATEYGLPLKAVLEAIAYCESNPPEMAEDWEMDEAREAARRLPTHGASLEPATDGKSPKDHSLTGRS